MLCFFFSSRRRHTRSKRDWSSDVCSSDLKWCRHHYVFKTSPPPFVEGFKTIDHHRTMLQMGTIWQLAQLRVRPVARERNDNVFIRHCSRLALYSENAR